MSHANKPPNNKAAFASKALIIKSPIRSNHCMSTNAVTRMSL